MLQALCDSQEPVSIVWTGENLEAACQGVFRPTKSPPIQIPQAPCRDVMSRCPGIRTLRSHPARRIGLMIVYPRTRKAKEVPLTNT